MARGVLTGIVKEHRPPHVMHAITIFEQDGKAPFGRISSYPLNISRFSSLRMCMPGLYVLELVFDLRIVVLQHRAIGLAQ